MQLKRVENHIQILCNVYQTQWGTVPNKRMSMKKKIFTPAVLASIPQMVANGLRVNQIAELLGASPGSVKVICSRHNISLGKRGGPRGPRGPYKKKDDFASSAVRLANVQLQIKVDVQTLALIAMCAEKKGTTVDAVASRVLEIVARDNLYDAVVDDAEWEPAWDLDATHHGQSSGPTASSNGEGSSCSNDARAAAERNPCDHGRRVRRQIVQGWNLDGLSWDGSTNVPGTWSPTFPTSGQGDNNQGDNNNSQGNAPLPAALPLFATGLGALGLLGWRRKRKASNSRG